MTNATQIETGIINKNNWTGEEANVQGTFDPQDRTIRFDIDGQAWQLVFRTWEELDGPNPAMTEEDKADLTRLIGSGGWVLADAEAEVRGGEVFIDGESYGRGTVIESGENDCRTPVEVLTSAACWIWNYV